MKKCVADEVDFFRVGSDLIGMFLFFSGWCVQLMVYWWFGLVVWDSRGTLD